MNTAVINIKTDPKVKAQAQEVAGELGFSLSALMNGYLRQLVRTRRVDFSLDETPSKYMVKALEESERQRKSGDYKSFKPEEALEYVKSIINEGKNR